MKLQSLCAAIVLGLLLAAAGAVARAATPSTYNINSQTVAANAVTCDWSISSYCRVSVTATLTTITLSNPVDGATYYLEFDQDATGRTITTPASILSQGGGTGPAASSLANAVEIWSLKYNLAKTKYYVTSITTTPPTFASVATTGNVTDGGVLILGSGPTTVSTAAGLLIASKLDTSGVPAASLTNQSSVANFYRQWHQGSSNAVVSNTAANFFALDGAGVAQAAAAEGDASTLVFGVSVFKNLVCGLYTAAGVLTVAGGTNYVVALRQNLATSALTCTIAATASSCTDLTHTVTTAALDQVDFVDTPLGTPTALVVKCTVEQDT